MKNGDRVRFRGIVEGESLTGTLSTRQGDLRCRGDRLPAGR
ncbi:MAG: hypothetical protein ACYTGC_14140 [Planctomycetota bacterium]